MASQVSVIMSVADESEEQLEKAIDSILSQTIKDFEFIIILDNKSNTKARRLISGHPDKRIRLLVNDRPSGLAYSLNRGLDESRGEYIARMDADDISLPQRLEKQLRFMKMHPDVDYLFGWVKYIDSQENVRKEFRPERREVQGLSKNIFRKHLLVHPTLMAKASSIKMDRYDPSFRRSQDFELWIRASRTRKFDLLEDFVLFFRLPVQSDLDTRIRKARDFNRFSIKAMKKNMQWGSPWFWKYFIMRHLELAALHLPKGILAILSPKAQYGNGRTLGLFFTSGVSLRLWKDKGLLGREKLIYEKHIEDKVFDKVIWFTYGRDDERLAQDLHRRGELHEAIEVVPMPRYFYTRLCMLSYSALLPFIRASKVKECDVIKSNQMLGSWSAVSARLLYNIPLIIRTGYTYSISLGKETASVHKNFLARVIERYAYRNADIIIAPREADVAYIAKSYSIPRSRISVISNYVDTSVFRKVRPFKKRDVVFVGRLEEQKNLFALIDALKGTGYTLDIFGDGTLKARLASHAREQGVNARFNSHIPNESLPRIYSEAKVFALPSHYEGLPKSLLEAMSCECACVVSRIPGSSDLIKDRATGLITGTDAGSIRKAIDALMKNASLRERLGKNARKVVEQGYSLESFASKERKIFASLKP